MTVHWINPDLTRKSAMLSIKRVTGQHTHDNLAMAINDISKEFGIQNKVVSYVTDNARNFVKAFMVFGIRIESENDEDDCDADDDTQSIGITSILSEECDFQVILPPHQRCAAHTLNLVAVNDSQKAENNPGFKKIARSSYSRCQALWKKQRSTQAADSTNPTFGKSLLTPCITRWNSMYESVKCLVLGVKKIGRERLNGLLDLLGLARISSVEILFLEEYLDVMKPIAVALNILQAEKNMFTGYLLPTITCVIRELEGKVAEKNLSSCKPLAMCLTEGLRKRFEPIMDDRMLIVAAGLIPQLKFQWLQGDKKEFAVSTLSKELSLLKGREVSREENGEVSSDDNS